MSYLFHCALLTYLLQTSPLAAQTPDPKAVEHYRAGYHLLKAHNYRNAAIELEQATLIDTTYGQAFYALGKAFQVLNEYPKAIQAYKTASRLGIAQERIPTELTQLYYLAAIKLYSQRKYKEAVLNFDQSLQLEPDNAKAYYIKGLCYRSLRNLEAATKAFRRAVEANPQYAKPHKSLGDVSRRQRNYTPAAQAYEQAIALDSTYMEAYGGLALVHIETQDFEATVALLQKALSINPDYADGYLYLGTALNRLGRQHEAVDPLRRSIELNSKNAEAHFRLAQAYYGKGDYRKAIDAGDNAVSRRRDYHAAEVVLGEAPAKLGQVQEARTWFTRASKDSFFKDYCTYKLKELENLNN